MSRSPRRLSRKIPLFGWNSAVWMLALVVLFFLVGCDSPTESEGSVLNPDFACEEVVPCALTCSDRTTGGKLPYSLSWQAEGHPPTAVINPTFKWSFGEQTLVTVRLTVIDDNGRGETRGPVERPFNICQVMASGDDDDDAGDASVTAGFRWQTRGLVVQFENRSVGGSTYFWTFGDGGMSTEFEPTYPYAIPDTYNVILEVCNSDGRRCDTEERSVTVEGGGFAS